MRTELVVLAFVMALVGGCFSESIGTVSPTPTQAPAAVTPTTPSPQAAPNSPQVPSQPPRFAVTPTPAPNVAKGTSLPSIGRLAYVRDGDIFVLDTATGVEQKLTNDGLNAQPRWSPDGLWLSFLKDRGELWTMRPDGSNAHWIDAVAAVWAPNGARQAYITTEGAIWVVDGSGASPHQLLPDGSGVRRLAWSPNGQWIALDRWDSNDNRSIPLGLWLVGLNDTSSRRLYLSPSEGEVRRIAYLAGWTSDSQGILFWESTQSASTAADGLPLFVVDLSGQSKRELATTLLSPEWLAISPKGDRLALVEGAGRETWRNKQIKSVSLQGGEMLDLSGDLGWADLWPIWSPDGSRLVFSRTQALDEAPTDLSSFLSRAKRGIWSMNPDGSGKRQLTNDAAFSDERPRWSANGQYILFVRRVVTAERPEAQLWAMRADGSGAQVLVKGLSLPGSSRFGFYGRFGWDAAFDWHFQP